MILGAVLAGGESRRMGADKALVAVDGEPMIRRVLSALEVVADRVVVAGPRRPLDGVEAIADPVDGPIGPLAGVAAATSLALGAGGPQSVVLAVAVDHPFVRPGTLQQLLVLYEGRAVVPVDGGVRQVTCAVYPAAWQAAIRQELDAGGSLQSLLGGMSHREVPPGEWGGWGEDGRSWFSVDDPEALAAGLERYRLIVE